MSQTQFNTNAYFVVPFNNSASRYTYEHYKITLIHAIAFAKESHNAAVIEILVRDLGVDINAPDENGNTALHLLCASFNLGNVNILHPGSTEVVSVYWPGTDNFEGHRIKLFLNLGANPEALNLGGLKPSQMGDVSRLSGEGVDEFNRRKIRRFDALLEFFNWRNVATADFSGTWVGSTA